MSATADGVIKAPFTVMNPTDTDATDGDYNVLICEACKFIKKNLRAWRV